MLCNPVPRGTEPWNTTPARTNAANTGIGSANRAESRISSSIPGLDWFSSSAAANRVSAAICRPSTQSRPPKESPSGVAGARTRSRQPTAWGSVLRSLRWFGSGTKDWDNGFAIIWLPDLSHPCAGVGVRRLCCCTREAAGRPNAGSDKRRNWERQSGSK